MGCFRVHREGKATNRSASSFYPASPHSIVTAGRIQGSPCAPASPASSCYSSTCGSDLPKSAPLHSSSSMFVKGHVTPLSPRRAETGAIKRSFSYGHSSKRLGIPKSSDARANEEIVLSANLFPLPAPPSVSVATALPSTTSTDDASSQSVSSAGSGSSISSPAPFSSCSVSSRSVNSKSCNNCSWSTLESQRVHPRALPLPPPPDGGGKLREFSYDELAGACLNFAQDFFIREGGAGPVFRAMLKHADGEGGSLEVSVTRLNRAHVHSFKKWRMEVRSLARLSHPHLCKVLGFSGEDSLSSPDMETGYERERLIVYEHTSKGGLDNLLYCRNGKAPLDWLTRVKIAIGVAQGLAYLHERIPRQIIYKSFRTINVQVDLNFNAKLSDYGFARSYGDLPLSSPAHFLSLDDQYMAPETRMSDELSTKSNVWSFGIVLLELLTGRQHMDDFFPAEERNLLQWCRPYLLDSKRLYLIMDPELKGRYPTRVAKLLADLALHCLAEDPEARPSMRDVASSICARAHLQACNGAGTKAGDASNVGAKNHANGISHINPANFTTNGWSNDESAYNYYGSKSKLPKSHNLASILASPARSLVGSLRPNETRDVHHAQSHKTRLKEFLSGEISKEASRSMARDYPFLSSYGLYGEIGVTLPLG